MVSRKRTALLAVQQRPASDPSERQALAWSRSTAADRVCDCDVLVAGVQSVGIEGEERDQLVVIGDSVDATCLASGLRKKVNVRARGWE